MHITATRDGDNSGARRSPTAGRRRLIPALRVNLALLLAVGLGLTVALSVAGIAGAAAWIGWRSRSENVRLSSDLYLQNMAQMLEQHMGAATNLTHSVADMVRTGQLTPVNGPDFTRMLQASLAAAPQAMAIGFVTPALDVIEVERRGGSFAVVHGSIRDDTQLRRRYEGAFTVIGTETSKTAGIWGGVTWQPAAREASLTYYQPVRRNGEGLGLVFTAMSVSSISRFLGELDQRTGATSFLLYDNDKVLAHPDLVRQTFAWLGRDQPLASVSDFGDPILQAIGAKEGGKRSLLRSIVEDAGGRRIRLGRSDYIFFDRRIDAFADKPLTFGSYRPSAKLSEELLRLQWAIAVAGVYVVLGMIAAWMMGRWLARPAQRVAQSASRVSELELADVKEIPPSWVRELNEAATAFNRMLFALRWFENYVPKTLVRRMVRQGSDDHLRSMKRDVTVLFTDIQGFTTLSERMSAEEVAAFLNHHFEIISHCIEAQGGTIDKYIGDGLMAFWGAPDDSPRHPERAVRAAIAIRAAIGEVAPNTRIRMGIHSGLAVVGNIGGSDRLNYTIVGDTVNIAARLERACKTLVPEEDRVAILVSVQTASLLPKEIPRMSLGRQVLIGREEKVEVFRL